MVFVFFGLLSRDAWGTADAVQVAPVAVDVLNRRWVYCRPSAAFMAVMIFRRIASRANDGRRAPG